MIKIIAMGNKMPTWIRDGVREYQKRLHDNFLLKVCEVPITTRDKTINLKQTQAKEAKIMLSFCEHTDKNIALAIDGKPNSTVQLSELFKQWQVSHRNINFFIGGPEGLAAEVENICSYKLSISNMTLPHPIARLILVEQIYRVSTILKNHPYHK